MILERPNSRRPRIILILILANGLYLISNLLIFISYFTSLRPMTLEVGGFSESFELGLALVYLITGAIHWVVLYGLLGVKPWSRLLQKFVAIPYLLYFPLGTIYALTTWFGLNRQEVDDYFLNRQS